jgi:hypothetical protein
MSVRNCIICNTSTSNGGVLGSIGDITVALCREHAGVCTMRCEGCGYSSVCSVRARL